MALYETIAHELLPALKALWEVVGPVLIPVLQTLGVILGVAIIGALWLVINVVRILISAWSSLVQAGIWVYNTIRNLDSTIRNAASSFGSLLYNAGRDLINGLIRGIQSIGGEVGKRISDIANGAVNTAKKILGIRSPSRVFAGIGENMGLGLIGGIKDTAGLVQNAINAMVPTSMNMGGLQPASSSVQTNIYGNIINGSEADRDMFFRRLTRSQETASRGGAQPAGMG
jgi:phage-related protein